MAIPGPGAPPPPEPGILKRLLSPPDPLQVDAGAQGELLVARVRLLLILLLLPIPLSSILFGNNVAESAVGISTNLSALLSRESCTTSWDAVLPALAGLCQQPDGRNASSVPRWGSSSCWASRTPPSTAARPSRCISSPSGPPVSATTRESPSPRASWRSSSTRYWSPIATSLWDLNDPRYAPFPYGLFDWSTQISRLILLGVASILAAAIVLRSQSLRRLSAATVLPGFPTGAISTSGSSSS